MPLHNLVLAAGMPEVFLQQHGETLLTIQAPIWPHDPAFDTLNTRLLCEVRSGSDTDTWSSVCCAMLMHEIRTPEGMQLRD